MREPKIYGPDPDRSASSSPRHWVLWYDENGRRVKKAFADSEQARLLYEEKLAGKPIDVQMMTLRKISTIERAVSELLAREDVSAIELQETRQRELDLEAENTRLRNEVAAKTRSTPATGVRKQEPPTGARSHVRLFRPDVAVRMGVPAAVILQQLRWLMRQENSGKILSDGKRYVFNTYPDWRSKFFPFYSVPTLERNFRLLEDQRLVLSKQPEGRASRRKWYTLTPEGISLMDSGVSEGAKRGEPSHQNEAVQNTSDCSVPSAQSETPSDVDVVRAPPPSGLESRKAAAAEISSKLIEELQKQFPLFDVPAEFKRYLKHRTQKGQVPFARGFREWMSRAEVPLVWPKRTTAETLSSPTVAGRPQSDPPGRETGGDSRFMEEFERHKKRSLTSSGPDSRPNLNGTEPL